MDGNQQATNDNINQQLIQEALSSEFNQNQRFLQEQQQEHQNTYATLPPNVAHGLVENATNFETLASFQDFSSDPTLHIQACGIPSSSSNSTMIPLQHRRVDNSASNALESEHEYIYQQYIQMMNNNTLDLNFQNFHPQQSQPPVLPARQEQDVFNELLSMASSRNQQHRSWHNDQFAPSASSSTSMLTNLEASMLITQQQQEQEQKQEQQQQQQPQETSFYNSFASSSNNINITPLLQENNTKNSIKISQDFVHPSVNSYRLRIFFYENSVFSNGIF